VKLFKEELSKLPELYQKIALQAIEEEEDRWKQGDFTETEKILLQSIQVVAAHLAFTIDNEILEEIKNVR
jgi:hypothetical protein